MFTKDTTASAELKELSPLLGSLSRSLPYLQPGEKWKVEFADELTEKLREEPILSAKTTPYIVSGDYFNVFSDQLLHKIRREDVEQEISELSPLLADLKRTLPFEKGENKIDLQTKISEVRANESSSVKVVSILRSKVFRYAAAASIIASILTIVYRQSIPVTDQNYVQTPASISDEQFNDLLASADEQDIINYLQQEGIQMNQSEIEMMMESSDLPDETDYYDDEFSDKFFQELQTDLNQKNL